MSQSRPSEQLSIAVLSFWHVHAGDYANSIRTNEDTRIAAVWDEDAERGQAEAGKLGVPFEGDLDVLLAREDIDGVTVTTSTAAHRDVIGRALAAGKHVFTEKLLAPTVKEAEELIAIARENGVRLVVSLPRLYEPATLAISRLIKEGKLGTVTYTRVRMAHDGWVNDWLPERFGDPDAAIGGALTDLGCHPAYLTQQFLGTSPATVEATCTSVTGRQVEDNAVATLTYPNGAIGVFEASNVTTPGAGTLEVRGTEGSLLSGFGSSALIAKGTHFDPESWQEVDLPDAGPKPFDQWVSHILAGTDADANLSAAIELTRVIVAANESAKAGRTLDYTTP